MTTPDIIACICGSGILGLLIGFIGGYAAFKGESQ